MRTIQNIFLVKALIIIINGKGNKYFDKNKSASFSMSGVNVNRILKLNYTKPETLLWFKFNKSFLL